MKHFVLLLRNGEQVHNSISCFPLMLQETGAFVYGAMSFLDKMSNGIVIQMIQVFYPSQNR